MNIKMYGDYVVLGARDASECVDNICDTIRELMKGIDPKRLVPGSTEIHIKTALLPEQFGGEHVTEFNAGEFVTVSIKFIAEVKEDGNE